MGKQSILVVDDSTINVKLMAELLRVSLENVDIFTAHSAKEALAILHTNSIDLLLLDIQMPEVDGFELAKMLREDEATQAIPIIFVTGELVEDIFVEAGMDLGAVDYLSKPIKNRELVEKISHYLK